MKKWLLSYLVISKKERTGALLLAMLIASIWLLPKYFHRQELDPEVIRLADHALASKPVKEEVVIHELKFVLFDPNTADDQTWLNMGITERNLQTIRRFQSKGGQFRVKEDLQKIYGIRRDVITRIMPYARIANLRGTTLRSNAYRQYPRSSPDEYKPRPFLKRTIDVVDLSLADTTALIALPGIGPTLARRIIQFRDKCGGFYSPEQVAEVYGLQDSVFQLIKPYLTIAEPNPRKLTLNELGIDSLAAHPYITYSEARAIVKDREQHGPFRQEEELLKIALLTPEWLRKVGPYLQFN
jgi:DNA uptake protein ComE-like DNA-binding protein